jgi:hypothetical protein
MPISPSRHLGNCEILQLAKGDTLFGLKGAERDSLTRLPAVRHETSGPIRPLHQFRLFQGLKRRFNMRKISPDRPEWCQSIGGSWRKNPVGSLAVSRLYRRNVVETAEIIEGDRADWRSPMINEGVTSGCPLRSPRSPFGPSPSVPSVR